MNGQNNPIKIHKSVSLKILLSFLLLSLSIFLYGQNVSEIFRNNLTVDMVMSTKINTVNEGRLKSLNAQFLFVPISDRRQKVISILYDSQPEANSTDTIRGEFTWNKLYPVYDVEYRARIKTTNYKYPIISTPFPVKNKTDSLKNYLKFDDIINRRHTIEKVAHSLVKNETELYNAVFNIGRWLNENITYLKTGFNNIESASTVFNTKSGDCDEISVLYLSMLRSVEIASRLVLGIAKGNNDFEYHAWIEVYFENCGWVPFDATFGEFGKIDQGHIKLVQHHTVPNTFSTVWEFYPFFGNIEIENKNFPEVSAKIVMSEPVFENNFDIKIVPFTRKVGINSYYPVKILLKNNSPYFISERFYISNFEHIKIIPAKNNYLLNFTPFETKEIKLLLINKGEKIHNYRYSALLHVSNRFGEKDTATVFFETGAKKLNEEKAKTILDTFSVPASQKIKPVD